MAAIYRRELKGYFNTMIGYVIIVFLLAFSGIYFMAYNLNYGYPYFSYVLSGGIFMLLIAAPLLTIAERIWHAEGEWLHCRYGTVLSGQLLLYIPGYQWGLRSDEWYEYTDGNDGKCAGHGTYRSGT